MILRLTNRFTDIAIVLLILAISVRVSVNVGCGVDTQFISLLSLKFVLSKKKNVTQSIRIAVYIIPLDFSMFFTIAEFSFTIVTHKYSVLSVIEQLFRTFNCTTFFLCLYQNLGYLPSQACVGHAIMSIHLKYK